MLEAEAAQEAIARGDHAWQPAADRADFAGEGFTIAAPDRGETVPADGVAVSSELHFEVAFDEPGTYLVWIRGWAPNGGGDSVHVGLDDQGATTASTITGFTGDSWSWSNLREDGIVAVLAVATPGIHTVRVWMREDGFVLDRLILTRNPNYRPEGKGPRPSSRVAEESPPAATPTSFEGAVLVGDGTNGLVVDDLLDAVTARDIERNLSGDGTDDAFPS